MHFRKILVTGACGFVGSRVMEYLKNHGYSVVGLDQYAKDGILACDVSDCEQLELALHNVNPDVIVHCAARKNLPDCEENKAASFATNCLSTETIANFAKLTNSKVIYLSSDVVFDGNRGNYNPTDTVCPINWYGKTKAFSEVILKSVDNVAVCRTALVVGPLDDEYKVFLKDELNNDTLINQTVLPQYIFHRLRNQQSVKLPAVIISNPTPIVLLCEILGKIIENDSCGIFHATGPDALSREEIGMFIADSFGFNRSLIVRDDTNISPLRPRNISMDSTATFDDLGIDPKEWSLKTYLASGALYD